MIVKNYRRTLQDWMTKWWVKFSVYSVVVFLDSVQDLGGNKRRE